MASGARSVWNNGVSQGGFAIPRRISKQKMIWTVNNPRAVELLSQLARSTARLAERLALAPVCGLSRVARRALRAGILWL